MDERPRVPTESVCQEQVGNGRRRTVRHSEDDQKVGKVDKDEERTPVSCVSHRGRRVSTTRPEPFRGSTGRRTRGGHRYRRDEESMVKPTLSRKTHTSERLILALRSVTERTRNPKGFGCTPKSCPMGDWGPESRSFVDTW